MSARTPAELKELFESDTFARDTTCTGPLGPEYTLSGTRLRLWTPTAQSVCVNLYRKGNGGVCMGTLPLETRAAGRVEHLSARRPARPLLHLYGDGGRREPRDRRPLRPRCRCERHPQHDRRSCPHRPLRVGAGCASGHPAGAARSVGGERARLLAGRLPAACAPAWRGKFMAFTQQGTTLHGDGIHPTCLNYLKRLGVKYVQLMPIFDFGSVDEAKPLLRQYNWGYDPTNYNVPEGSYSTDPTRGEVRIRECREMIAALHAAGIGVVMDVVYNHMYRNENPLNDTVPCYFFRQNEDGSFSNGSGCGNEFASERPMARR